MFKPDSMALLFQALAPRLARHVATSFPRLCPGRVEDAVADTFLIACASPELLSAAFDRGGMTQVIGVLRTIAWRFARAQVCRGSGAWEISTPAEAMREDSQGPDQELITELHLHLAAMIGAAANAISAKNADRLGCALHERLLDGEDDCAVARRHALPREYINRARHLVADQLLAAA